MFSLGTSRGPLPAFVRIFGLLTLNFKSLSAPMRQDHIRSDWPFINADWRK